MAIFEYTAVNGQGQQSAGVVNAANRSAAIDLVVDKGLSPVEVAERGAGGKAATAGSGSVNLFGGGDRVPAASVETFIRELANLLTAGVSLARALEILNREASHPAAKKQWAAIRGEVMDGSSLADALARFPRSFPPVNVAMVRAGETGGFLDSVLIQIADFQEREKDLKGRVKAAMVYPAILAIMMVVVMIFMMTFFIPRFTKIFDSFGGALPMLTKVIVAISEGILTYGFWAGGAVVVLVMMIRRALETEVGQRRYERVMLKMPGFGPVMSRFALVRFCRMLGTLVGAGVPLVDSLRVAREAIGNRTLSDAVNRAVDSVQEGGTLSHSLAATPELFPAGAVEMVAVAEETGRLDKELVRLSAHYEKELDAKLRILIVALEPAMLFLMAALVGAMVVGMLLPLFSLQDLIK